MLINEIITKESNKKQTYKKDGELLVKRYNPIETIMGDPEYVQFILDQQPITFYVESIKQYTDLIEKVLATSGVVERHGRSRYFKVNVPFKIRYKHANAYLTAKAGQHIDSSVLATR